MKTNKPAIRLTLSKMTLKNLSVQTGVKTGQVVGARPPVSGASCQKTCDTCECGSI